MNIYSKHFNTRITPQNQPIPGSSQVKNNAGGYVWDAGDWVRLDRFLILGSEGGNYYTEEKKLTMENAQAALRCIQEDGMRVVNRVVEISEAGRAAKNDPALFVLALCAASPDEAVRQLALSNLSKVARTGTHLFTFLEMVQGFRGWGRTLSRAVSDWFNNKSLNDLAYQLIKYRQRNGWTHRDAMRLSHVKPNSEERNALYRWVVKGEDSTSVRGIKVVDGFLKVQEAQTAKYAAELIAEYKLPREAVPTQFLKNVEVWDAMLPNMPMTAMIRNLGNMGTSGLLVPGNWNAIQTVVGKLTDIEQLKKARVHPISVLVALLTYRQGRGLLGSNSWAVVPQVSDALDQAFYKSFDFVEPTGKRYMLGLDVSGSMSSPVSGIQQLSCAMGTAAMAMVTARVEKNYIMQAFSHQLVNLNITASMDLNTIMKMTRDMNFGGTDCALPIQYARRNKLPVDVFITYTDSETWAGEQHAAQALAAYRQEMGIPAKLAVVAMAGNRWTIAEPKDESSMNFVGFSTDTPAAINEFVKL